MVENWRKMDCRQERQTEKVLLVRSADAFIVTAIDGLITTSTRAKESVCF